MEWEDTVMGDKELDEALQIGEYRFDDVRESHRVVARNQAEISFKAGIKEVVEWMHKAMAFTNSENLPPNILRIDFNYEEWRAKLEEWGIE